MLTEGKTRSNIKHLEASIPPIKPPNGPSRNLSIWIKCTNCNGKMVETNELLTSNPPQRKFKCGNCDHISTLFVGEEVVEHSLVEDNKIMEEYKIDIPKVGAIDLSRVEFISEISSCFDDHCIELKFYCINTSSKTYEIYELDFPREKLLRLWRQI